MEIGIIFGYYLCLSSICLKFFLNNVILKGRNNHFVHISLAIIFCMSHIIFLFSPFCFHLSFPYFHSLSKCSYSCPFHPFPSTSWCWWPQVKFWRQSSLLNSRQRMLQRPMSDVLTGCFGVFISSFRHLGEAFMYTRPWKKRFRPRIHYNLCTITRVYIYGFYIMSILFGKNIDTRKLLWELLLLLWDPIITWLIFF